MNKRLFIGILLCSGIMFACNDVKEQPPRTNTVVKDYLLPQPHPLTAAERDTINARVVRYNESIQ